MRSEMSLNDMNRFILNKQDNAILPSIFKSSNLTNYFPSTVTYIILVDKFNDDQIKTRINHEELVLWMM